ncbi:hypothetical protein ACPA9J_01265 [Pseudomonas aeruginosa]
MNQGRSSSRSAKRTYRRSRRSPCARARDPDARHAAGRRRDRAPAASPGTTVVARREGTVVGRRTRPSLRHFLEVSDLIEELGPSLRIQSPAGALPAGAPGAEQQAGARRAAALRRLLVARGYQEAITSASSIRPCSNCSDRTPSR